MPANTPLGYPYPLGTDRLADGDDAIHALATAVEQKAGVFAGGLISVNVTTGGSASSAAVTFPVGRFTTPPNVTVTHTLAASGTVGASAQSVTAAGFSVSAVRGTAGAMSVYWIAIQQG